MAIKIGQTNFELETISGPLREISFGRLLQLNKRPRR